MITVNCEERREFEANSAGLFEACTFAAEEIGGELDRLVEYDGRYLDESAVLAIYDGGEGVAEGYLAQMTFSRGFPR